MATSQYGENKMATAKTPTHKLEPIANRIIGLYSVPTKVQVIRTSVVVK